MDWLYVLLCVLLPCCTGFGQTVLHDFDDPAAWKPNADGGNAPRVSVDGEFAREGSALRLAYTDSPPHWGNLTGPCNVPADARALHLWVYKHAADPRAAMHIWLFEPDGDCWAQRIGFNGRDLEALQVGWHEARLPIAGFRFDPRGNNTRAMTSVDRMLIGCNFDDFEVTIDSMTWEVGPGEKLLPLTKTEGLQVESGELGSVGILDMDDGLPDEFVTAHPPKKLATALRARGFGVTILKPGDLASAELLTPDAFGALILPWGPYFPLAAKDSFIAYLRAGGSFLATDGYAFDRPVLFTESGWSTMGPEITAGEMNQPGPKAPTTRINTRAGKPGDALSLHPEQIGTFSPQFPLEHAVELRLTDWYANPAGLGEGFATEAARAKLPHYRFDAPVEGFSACGQTGVNGAVFPASYRRWVPVLEAYGASGDDAAAGRDSLRGTALSILHNYSGHYEGSSWAFSGLTSATDLFLGDEARIGLLVRVLRDITEKVFLYDLKTDLACYEPGETATITVQAANHGKKPATRAIAIEVGDGTVLEQELQLAPGAKQAVETTVSIDELAQDYDLVPIRAVLSEQQRIADVMESGLCIRNEQVLASGPKMDWSGNYMTVDGRPTFMVGTNQTGMMYFGAYENPATWDRDFAAMNAHNYHIMRILHFSPYSAGGYEGRPTNNPLDLVNRPKKFVRQMDAIVQLANKHRVAIFLSLHDWMGTVLTDEELQAQRDWNQFWVERYRDVPGVFYDVQNEPSVRALDRPDVVRLWNEFLQGRYATDADLTAAWDKNPPETAMPNVPLGKTTEDWFDVRSADRKRFETELLNRWVKANVDGARAGDPDTDICVGYLPHMSPADKILGVKHTDFSNMHYYGSPDRMPLEFKMIDRRFVGKGLSLGEFGAREAHDARTNGSFRVPVQESIDRFQAYMHYAAGLGGAFICNWDWKDFDESVFPWGLMQACSYITKPWLHTLEQESLLLSLAEPVYESPEVFILAPDSHRVGPRFGDMHEAMLRSISLLLDQRVNFGMVNEEDIAALPESAKALIWPLPYCPDDDTFERVLDWVKAGGTLYLSGDVSFDRTRKPTRAQRKEQLGLPAASPASPFDTPADRWDDEPITSTVGAGKVLFVPYPLELKGRDADGAVYSRFVSLAGLSPIPIQPADAPVRVLSIPSRDGSRVYMLARTSDGADLLDVTLPARGAQATEGPAEDVTVQLTDNGFSFIITGPRGQVLAAESQGQIRIGGRTVATAQAHFAVASLDGKDLRQADRLLVLPHQCREVSVAGLVVGEPRLCHVATLMGTGASSTAGEAIAFNAGTPGQVAVIAPENQISEAVAFVQKQTSLRFD